MVDTRVKERLTGAIILVALLVLLVPELLSGPGSSAATAHPSAADGQQMRSYTIDLADDAATRRSAAAPVAEAPTPTAPAGKPIEATANGAQPAREAVDAKPEADRSGGTASVERTPSASPASAGSSSDAGRAAPSAAVAEPEPARPATPTAPRPAAAERPVAGGWAVQVGSFASRENAERLAQELKDKGFTSHVNESSGKGKRLWRVRVGPEPDRDSAVALGARLRAAGQPGSVVPTP